MPSSDPVLGATAIQRLLSGMESTTVRDHLADLQTKLCLRAPVGNVAGAVWPQLDAHIHRVGGAGTDRDIPLSTRLTIVRWPMGAAGQQHDGQKRGGGRRYLHREKLSLATSLFHPLQQGRVPGCGAGGL